MSITHFEYRPGRPRCGCDSCYRQHKVKSLALTKFPSEVTCKRCIKAMPPKCECCNSDGYHEFEGARYQCTDAACKWADKTLPVYAA